MTAQLLAERQPDSADPSLGSPAEVPSTRAGRAGDRRAAATAGRTLLISAALTILGALLLGGVLEITVLGSLKHARAQTVHYGELREQLAKSIAPVGPTDSDGARLALGAPVAILEIPKLNLREVVGEGTTAGVLIDGPGHLRSSVLPGQVGISTVYGRQAAYGGPFGRLVDLRPGDQFTVITGQGLHRYKVIGSRRAGDPVPALRSGTGRLVLATADGTAFAPDGVLRVDADLVSDVQPTPPVGFTSSSLSAAERPMASDQIALVALVLWTQSLLLAALAVVYLRARWGRWQTWTVAVPVLLTLALKVIDEAARLLPNLL